MPLRRPHIAVACSQSSERASLADWLTKLGYDPVPLHDLSQLDQSLKAGPIEAFIADLTLIRHATELAGLLRRLGTNRPLVVIGDANRVPANLRDDVSVISRPLTQESIALGVGLALAEGRPVRRFARKRLDPVPASAQGVAVTICEASERGVGLELAGPRPNALPPLFSLRIPDFGVHVVVRRAWVAPFTPELMRCGGTVEGDLADATTPWASFVREAPTPAAPTAARR